jgi:hypothetical protein
MYKIIVRYSKGGLVAMNLKADSVFLAREKARHMKSQFFHLEIEHPDGHTIPTDAEE